LMLCISWVDPESVTAEFNSYFFRDLLKPETR
jgi:hypothetical protein